MTVENCANCGGTHFGSYECPYFKAPCVVCGEDTLWACFDCGIETGNTVHICGKRPCRDEHEAEHRKPIAITLSKARTESE